MHLLRYYITLLIIHCFIYSKAQHTLSKFPHPINTNYHNEVCPIVSTTGDVLFFTRLGSNDFNKTLIIDGEDIFTALDYEAYLDKLTAIYNQISATSIVDPVHSAFNQDVYLAKMNKNVVMDVFHPGYPLNNALPNSICSTFGDEGQYLLLNEFDENGGMVEGFSYVSIRNNSQFDFPKPIRIKNFKHTGQNINASMSLDKQHLFLSIYNVEHENKDLYLSIKINDTTYASPVLIDKINTSFGEITPYISSDKTKLYFASDRPGGRGGFDIYFVERLDYSYLNWSQPKSFDPPLNTGYSESYPYLSGEHIYFASDRDGTSDIFKVKTKRTDDENISIKVNVKATKEDGSKFPSEIKWGNAYTNTSINWDGYFRARNGEHSFTIHQNLPFAVTAENRNLTTAIKIIDPQELYDKGINEITIDLVLGDVQISETYTSESMVTSESIIPNDIEEGTTIILNNIYFKRATSDVLAESINAIQKLASVINRKPQLIISIDGHTDNVGNEKDLKELSEQRAITIKNKLIEFGVNPKQILTRGFGSEKPLNDNTTEEKKQQNRRVEITILKNQ